MIINNQGSLFKLKKDEYDIILNRETEVEKKPLHDEDMSFRTLC